MKSHGKLYCLKKLPDLSKPVYKNLRLTYQSKGIITILDENGGKLDRDTLLEKLEKTLFTHQEATDMLRWWQSKLIKAGLLEIQKIKLP